jgi:D-alanyl-lipoteichoic acid acyltransferase DltB (MBOAT superfamily)
MIFHSIDFIVFLVVVLGVYWSLGHRAQNLFLLFASYFFYGYIHPWFLILILISTVVDYFCGLKIFRHPGHKKFFLMISLVVNLGLLSTFKYFDFFINNFNFFFEIIGLPTFSLNLNIFLPIGISFYTFQTLSYTIDIYRGKLNPRRSFLDFALFVAFFPQLVAGPIERARNLIPQIESKRMVYIPKIQEGLYLMIWGFFKKLVIADNIAITCNKIFAIKDVSFSLIWVGAFAFYIQIFADFSAYTDIARGTAKLFGFNLIRNFKHPFIAISPSDFWKRWHMSLSYWLRDYVYIPLRRKGARDNVVLVSFSLMSTFFLCGLWHGASWNFALWGVYYGVLVLIFRYAGKLMPSFLKKAKSLIPVRILFMFILTTIGCLIFRESDFNYLIKYFMLVPGTETVKQFNAAKYLFIMTSLYSLPLWLHIAYSLLMEKIPEHSFKYRDVSLSAFKTVACMVMILGLILLHSDIKTDFIYYKF